jgi:hypothetical protein
LLNGQTNRLEADPLLTLPDLLRIEASQSPILQPLDDAADYRGLAATRRAGQQQVLRKAAHRYGS